MASSGLLVPGRCHALRAASRSFVLATLRALHLDPASGRGRGLGSEAMEGHRFVQSAEPIIEETRYIYPPWSPKAGALVTKGPTARRGAAAAGPTPVSSMCRGLFAQRHEPSQGQLPAYARHVVPTHEYQSGGQPAHGQPAHVAPACCRALGARPPPSSSGQHQKSTEVGARFRAHRGQRWLLRALRPSEVVDLTSRSISDD